MGKSAKSKTTALSTMTRGRTAWRRISPFFRGSRGRISLISLVSVLAGLAEAALLTLIATIAMSIAEETDSVTIGALGFEFTFGRLTLLLTSLGLAVLRGCLQLWLAYLPAQMSGKAIADLRQRLFDAFIGASWETKASEREGGFQSLMINQINATAQTIIQISATISAALMFLTLLVSAVAMSPATAAVITVTSLLLFILLRPMARNLRQSSTALSAEGIEAAKTTQGVAAMAEEIQVFGASDHYRKKYYDQLRAVRLPFQHTRFMAGAVPAMYQSVALLVLVVALFAASLFGGESLAALGAVVLMLVRAVTYGQRVQTSITNIDEKVPFMLHLADAIERYESNVEDPGSRSVAEVTSLEMDGVRFSYPDSPEVLRSMSFNISQGEVVGIVGPSGAGKSTLVQMLLRLREPTGGRYLVNGVDAATILRSDWRNLVAYLPQRPQLTFGTVADNIRFFREISHDEVIRAAKRAHVHEDILKLPNGYDTIVGQRATAVSGGQAQRICLARALVANPTVVILDEPTSALDVKSEELVQDSLRELADEAIVFLVSHRLSTLAICHRVMVVNSGSVEAFDTSQNLLHSNRFFKEVTAISAWNRDSRDALSAEEGFGESS